MNQRTAKLIRRFSAKTDSRLSRHGIKGRKRIWNQMPRPKRFEFRQVMQFALTV